jgi:hypothetical protein
MRIALFSEVFLPKIDGITNRLTHTIRCLRDDGHDVLVFAPQGAVASHAGARVVRVPGLPFPPYPELKVCAVRVAKAEKGTVVRQVAGTA